MKLPVYSFAGTKMTDLTVKDSSDAAKESSDKILDSTLRSLSLVVNYVRDNSRVATADTKDRGEVRGGGIKPWKQKGTGRARAGSSRSPIWRGGGVTFGPLSIRNFSSRLPKKMIQQALVAALADKMNNNACIVIDSFDTKEPKTKPALQLLTKIESLNKKVLVIVPSGNVNAALSFRNIANVVINTESSVNILDCMAADVIVCSKEYAMKQFGASESKVVKEAKPAEKAKETA